MTKELHVMIQSAPVYADNPNLITKEQLALVMMAMQGVKGGVQKAEKMRFGGGFSPPSEANREIYLLYFVNGSIHNAGLVYRDMFVNGIEHAQQLVASE